MTIVPTPDVTSVPPGEPLWGKWAPLVDRLATLAPGEAERVSPPLTPAQVSSLRSAARWRGRTLHVRQIPDGTYLWLGRELPSASTSGIGPRLNHHRRR